MYSLGEFEIIDSISKISCGCSCSQYDTPHSQENIGETWSHCRGTPASSCAGHSSHLSYYSSPSTTWTCPIGLGENTTKSLKLSNCLTTYFYVKSNLKVGLLSQLFYLRSPYFAKLRFRFGHFYLLKSDPKVPGNENRQKKRRQKWLKVKSKDIDLIFGESLNYKSGLGFFFVPALVLLFLRSQLRHFRWKWPYWGDKKWHFQCWYEKSKATFTGSNIIDIISYHKNQFIIIKAKVTKTKSAILQSKETSNKKLKKTDPSWISILH